MLSFNLGVPRLLRVLPKPAGEVVLPAWMLRSGAICKHEKVDNIPAAQQWLTALHIDTTQESVVRVVGTNGHALIRSEWEVDNKKLRPTFRGHAALPNGFALPKILRQTLATVKKGESELVRLTCFKGRVTALTSACPDVALRGPRVATTFPVDPVETPSHWNPSVDKVVEDALADVEGLDKKGPVLRLVPKNLAYLLDVLTSMGESYGHGLLTSLTLRTPTKGRVIVLQDAVFNTRVLALYALSAY